MPGKKPMKKVGVNKKKRPKAMRGGTWGLEEYLEVKTITGWN